MAIADSTKVRVYIGGSIIDYEQNASVNWTQEFDQIAPTGSSDAAFTVVKPRRKSGTMTINAYYGTGSNNDYETLFNAWKAGTELTILYEDPASGEWSLSGSAYVQSLSTTSAKGQDPTYNASLIISGEVSIATN